jgi:hypothetical protein
MAHKTTIVGVRNWKLIILFIMFTGLFSIGTFASFSAGFLGCTAILCVICVVNIPKDNAMVYTRPFGSVPRILIGPKTTFLIPGSQIMIPIRIPGANSDGKTVSFERSTYTFKHRIQEERDDTIGIRVRLTTVNWRVENPIKCLNYSGDVLDGIHTLAFLDPEDRVAKDIREAMGVCDVTIAHSIISSETEPGICRECAAKTVNSTDILNLATMVVKTCKQFKMGDNSTAAVLNAVLSARATKSTILIAPGGGGVAHVEQSPDKKDK